MHSEDDAVGRRSVRPSYAGILLKRLTAAL